MMRKLLIGPALMGAGYAAGSYYGASAQQLVHKSPDATYEGFSAAIADMPQSGTTEFEGGRPMPFEVRVDRTLDQQLIVHLLFDGREGGWTEFDFAPQGDGKATMVTAKAHGERAVLSDALAGTSRARLAYAPDWMLNLLTLRPWLQQRAQEIEQGEPVSGGYEAAQPPQQVSSQAGAPSVDPNADAQRHLNGG
jgi:hypothetical protein